MAEREGFEPSTDLPLCLIPGRGAFSRTLQAIPGWAGDVEQH
jgi:hypothetical protein